ncbi:P-loop containing nucleoside triphosphate hydrolase protein [Lentinula aff. lateritia]|uniref:P-loop containing nucleoside triphosphate hydrolase protein n=1 Tax=Lentinula aff. lateritia TaxID=2804960 RepID=A0ACC1UE37_9AGAR|nr:P-loop containing nucleoside triphosphate hydrolase protein [Lentinula aff. lateritia]
MLDCIIYGYSSFLATATMLLRYKWSKILSIHLEVVLLTSLLVYGLNIMVPIIVSAENIVGHCEDDTQSWVKFIALLLGAVLLPLLIPRQYVPVDPKNPLSAPNPEQTASLLSLVFFTYLDSLVWKASKVPHLPTEALPPLSDNDQARILRAKAMSMLDPLSGGGSRHIFFSIIRVFLGDMASMSIALICNATTAFVPAISTNRLLVYLETRESGNDMLPWFWISLLFVGPVLASISVEWYMRIVLRTFVRVEALLTELIFEHAVRARAKSDAGDDGQTSMLRNSFSFHITAQNNASAANIDTLITVDLHTMEEGQHFLVLVTFVPVQLIICIVILYKLLGWSAFVGLGLTLVMVPITGTATKSLHSVQHEKMKKTDSRVQFFTHVVNVLRMVKLFGWEEKMSEKIAQKRAVELKASRKARFIELLLITLVARRELNASIAFPSLVVFDSFRNQIQLAFIRGTECVKAKVSMDRIHKFLQSNSGTAVRVSNEEYSDKIGFHNASFTWSKSTGGTATPSRNFVLTVAGNLHFKPNALNLVVGPTGSGKTSLLLALLGEMHFAPLSNDAWFNLPRSGGIAYAAQESWVLNETIRDNILLGSPYDEDRYRKVIKQCALERDLTLFAAGDETEIGEKGLTLSGGQKARLTLARAVYSKSSILLLDDTMAALDVHTSKWIVDECLSGDLLQDRTVIMVFQGIDFSIQSHNVALLSPLVQCYITMKDGIATQSYDVEAYLDSSKELLEQLEERVDSDAKEEKKVDSSNGKLIVSEEVHKGTGASWAAINLYITGLGGKHPFIFFVTFFSCLATSHLVGVVQTWYLGYWASQYNDYPPAETPVSRIITRSTQDIGSIDFALPIITSRVCDITISLLFKIGAVVIFTPMFFLPSIFLVALGTWVGSLYLKAQSSVKREMLIAKAPVVGLIGAVSTGIVSVRAYSAQDQFADLLMTRIDHYSRSARVFHNLQRWMAIRTETLAGIFSAGLAWWLVYFTNSDASTTGFLLNLAVTFSGGIVWWVIAVNGLEAETHLPVHSLERLESYLQIDQEARSNDGRIPPAHWPSSGELRVENLSAKYAPDDPEVLHELSFHIKSGERIGVALLRCILTRGDVFYDGILTSTLNLDSLRSQITIIPQTPELISGNLRQNLDPFEEHADYVLNDALKSAGLVSLQEDLENEDKLDLDTPISSGGANLSVGQRQIIALARAIVRQSKLLILDEDYKTDTIIQESLRNEYKARGGDATIITIAHRLQTVMDASRIMVLDAGRIVEFDSPKALLQRSTGHFRSMVDNANDRLTLLTMVQG